LAEERRQRFFEGLDAESIRGFQTMYYWFIVVAGLYQLVSDGPPEPVAASLGPPYYEGWVLLNIVCPIMTLIGRRIFGKVGRDTLPGAPNGSRGAALLQLAGDGGVWGLILIYTACLINTTYFGQPLYVTIYFLMGVPGGFMFTLRSVRRVLQIKRREQRMP
jgi:hypothetical protein